MIPWQLQQYRDHGVSTTNAAPYGHTSSCAMSDAESWQCLKGDYGVVCTDNEEEDISSTKQSIDEERVTYLTSPCSPKGTNLLNFWAVSFYFSGACYDNLCLARSICTTTWHGSRLPWTTYPFKCPQCPVNGVSLTSFVHEILVLRSGTCFMQCQWRSRPRHFSQFHDPIDS